MIFYATFFEVRLGFIFSPLINERSGNTKIYPLAEKNSVFAQLFFGVRWGCIYPPQVVEVENGKKTSDFKKNFYLEQLFLKSVRVLFFYPLNW